MTIRFFDPGRAYLKIKDEIDSEMQRVLAVGDLILRKDIEKFEENLAEFVGTRYAIALSSGTDALLLSIQALGLEKNLITVPSHTFKATCGAIINSGNIPVVYDMDGTRDNGAGLKVDAHIVVHIAGELSPIPKGIVIEDACQALGAVKNPTTSAQCWSFYPAKILGAYGDAGAVTTNDPDIAEYIREARNHFKKDNTDFGGNHRMDNLQAAILNVKFKYLPEYLARRKEIAERYLDALSSLPIGLPNNQPGRVWQDFIVRTGSRNELFDFLSKEEVETIKNEYRFSPEYPKLPLAAMYEAETLRMPCNPDLTDDEVEYVIQKIKEFYADSM